mmetsp:Transcript_10162/g.20670  ORF Transcript_10162/g.20670 Transcript_10162/m.20670 type:complete len:136 (+) Transcript_10162:294-701(+)
MFAASPFLAGGLGLDSRADAPRQPAGSGSRRGWSSKAGGPTPTPPPQMKGKGPWRTPRGALPQTRVPADLRPRGPGYTHTGLPNWVFGAALCMFVGGAYFYTMRAVRGKNPGGAKEELEQAIRKELEQSAGKQQQ